MKIKKKSTIKIPTNISVIYCSKKKIIIFSGPNHRKSLKLKLKLVISKCKKFIKVTNVPFLKISNTEKKNLRSLQGTITALIKQLIIETSITLYQKLKLVGIGYRVFPVETFENFLFAFKLGFSHLLYITIPKVIKVFLKKQTQLFIVGHSYQHITQIASTIRGIKKPEPYKGKGILYTNETIILKKGKKI
jgi:large subunit ribosomal protein L6